MSSRQENREYKLRRKCFVVWDAAEEEGSRIRTLRYLFQALLQRPLPVSEYVRRTVDVVKVQTAVIQSQSTKYSTDAN